MRSPDSEYFGFTLKYKLSEFNSEPYEYYKTFEEASAGVARVMEFHRSEIEDKLGDIYEKPIVRIYRVSKVMPFDEAGKFTDHF